MTELETNQHRYSSLRKILERPGPFCHPDFEPSPDILTFLQESCRVLVVGAGGLGCELLKNLALLGFRDIHVVDMDTIELSNLNRQFLFRHSDIGSSKAATAAKFINGRIPGCRVTPHHCRMQELDDGFYRDFHLVACGLDSVMGRRWINGMLISLLKYDDDGTLDPSSVVPLVDGGAEGFKGSARVILPGCNACIECTLALFPPQVAYPLCTLASTPRLPEHCVEYVKLLQWPRDKPFQGPLDADDPAHIAWVHEKAVERAAQFSIPGVTYRLVQGVVKNIIPAVASTNAVVAAAVSTECFKLATSCYAPLDNYMVFSDLNGIYTYSYEAERRPDCLACSQVAKSVPASSSQTLKQLITWLTDSPDLQMRSPGLTTVVNGRNKTLYMSGVPSIEAATRANLDKTLGDLGLVDGTELLVADVTSPATLVLRLKIDEVEAK